MRVFLLDLWLDLREKRLAPVALALIAGVLLVPFVLAADDAEPPPPPPAAQAGEGEGLPNVSVDDEGEIDSRLTAFDPRDPFEPRSAAQLAAAGEGGGAATGEATGGEAAGGGSGATTTGDGTTAGGGTGTGDTGGGAVSPDSGSGGGTGTGTTGGERRTVFFTYTVDVLFGEEGSERTRRGVRRLQILPNEDNPIVVFLGVTTSGRTAVFLVNQGVQATGEGACRPSRDECTFLYLRDDAEHNTAILTAEDGTVYRLSLRDINRVAVGAESDESNRSGSGDDRPAFTGSNRRDDAPPGEPESSDDESKSERSSFRAPTLADSGRR